MKFCKNNSPAMDQLAGTILREVAEAIDADARLPRLLKCVVLGGGYGRGAGGVFRSADGSERLYNDLDLFVELCNRRDRTECRERLREIERRLTNRYTVEVEFGPPTTSAEFHCQNATLMLQELLRGWVPVWGNPEIFRNLPRLEWTELPLTEAARLLLNRGTGLLLAQQRLCNRVPTREELDFAMRNACKGVLGAADAWLLSRGKYDFSPEIRLERLAGTGLEAAYAKALAFKYAPTVPTGAEVSEFEKTAEKIWQDTVRKFRMTPYCAVPENRWEQLKNLIFRLQYFRGDAAGYGLAHPRERLLDALPSLLDGAPDAQTARRLAMPSGSGVPDLQNRFITLWHRFN